MRLSLRFIIPLATILTLMAYGLVPLADELTKQWFIRDLDLRAQLISTTIQDPLAPLIEKNEVQKIKSLFERFTKDERLFALGYCDNSNRLLYKTKTFPAAIDCQATNTVRPELLRLRKGAVHVSFRPLQDDFPEHGRLIVIHDMSFVEGRSELTRQYIFYLFLILGAVISLVTVFIAQLSWKGWISGIRAILKGEGLVRPLSQAHELKPVLKDVKALVRDLERDRKIRDELQISWSPRTLKELLHNELAGDEILIVSNREPYIHNHKEGKVIVQVPASGLVTALEPIMRACSGTWIAHGSGTADKEAVDENDHVMVPPDKPAYRIRRVWLSREEELGYYYGFANEGLWPLCHIAHTRPIFRTSDWEKYVQVNRKFAEAVVSEAKTEDPVVLVQDYHFALLPRMVREKLPRATIISFWHIPWPNPEAFGICPWREEILEGILGSSILGFHTRFHCNNFLDSVDRFMECRIDRETSTVSLEKKLTAINSYPISIEWPSRWLKGQKTIPDCRKAVRQSNDIAPDCKVGVGVDRLDYTKGILERFITIERLFELFPEWIGKFTFIQIAAPTRSSITQYQSFENQVRALASQINQRFATSSWNPILLKAEHHGSEQIFEYFRASELCFVSSLHDGMNLVAKEFVSARDDEQGVLVLSQFAGASRELPEAVIVNPYNIDQCAQALAGALNMPEREQRDRMRSMRGLLQEFNIFRWAGRMLIDAARIRQQNRFFGKLRESGLSYFSAEK